MVREILVKACHVNIYDHSWLYFATICVFFVPQDQLINRSSLGLSHEACGTCMYTCSTVFILRFPCLVVAPS